MSELRPTVEAGSEPGGGVKLDGKVPWPTSLIACEFFVFVWNRDYERFELLLDDEEHTSYNLGSDTQRIIKWLRNIGMFDLGCRGIDLAREFGAAQVIPPQNRVLVLKNPPPKTRVLFKDAEKESGNVRYRTLPFIGVADSRGR